MKRTFFRFLQAAVLGTLLSPAVRATDAIPPTLVFSIPQPGSTDVGVTSPIIFLFSESMAPTQSIEWSANVNPANFQYAWAQEGMMLMATYQGGLPGNATITWKLNPTAGNTANFKDLAGNILLVNQFQGSFTTGAGSTGDPCAQDDGRGSAIITKELKYVQTGNSAPVPDQETPAIFGAFFRPATNQTVSAVSVSAPSGNVTLSNVFGMWFANEEFANASALEAAYPAGNYTISSAGSASGSATVVLGTTAGIPVPRISNLAALAAMNVSNAFTLEFSAFAGAGQIDGITIEISGVDEEDGRFQAPDPCVPRDLPNTATSVVIPADTFKAGQAFRGTISFARIAINNSGIPNSTVMAAASVRTSFEFTIGGGLTPRQPMWAGVVRNEDGTLTYTIQGDTGITLSIEGSDVATGGWGQLTTAVLATGSHQITIDPRLAPKRFLRARVL